jgi:hypothetical protein
VQVAFYAMLMAVYAKEHGIEVYSILVGEFGESASDAIVSDPTRFTY